MLGLIEVVIGAKVVYTVGKINGIIVGDSVPPPLPALGLEGLYVVGVRVDEKDGNSVVIPLEGATVGMSVRFKFIYTEPSHVEKNKQLAGPPQVAAFELFP